MEEIILKLSRISGTTFMLFTTATYSGALTYHSWIERKADGDEIKIKRESENSAHEALTEAFNAFRKLVTEGYEPSALAPTISLLERKLDDGVPF